MLRPLTRVANLLVINRAIPLKIANSIGIASLALHTLFSGYAIAQVIPDNTLGDESSTVTPLDAVGLPIDQIDNGAIQGTNLFHSFQEFSVNENRGAYFFSPANILNILVRVTGINPSLLLGTVGTFGDSTPNLFLINPNGIIFGPNAKLDVGGSFVATTASAVQLGDTGLFSASEPDTSNLLTINPSALFFNALSNQAEIINRSTGTTPVLGFSTNDLPSISGLQVPDGRSLLLVGGDVTLEDGGRLNALGGRIELSGLAAPGTVGLEINGNIFSLKFAPNSLLSNVSLVNDARASVRGLGGGSIVVNANTFTATDGGRLVAGTEGLGNGEDITVNTNGFNISGIGLSGAGSGVYNEALVTASGGGGNIFINTNSFQASEGASIGSFTSGTGDGGNIYIQAESLSLTNGARLIASTFGQGNAGSVTVNVRDTASFDGVGSNGIPSVAASTVSLGAVGNGGSVNIETGSLSVTNGAALIASTFGQGDAGSVNVNARDSVSFDGVGSNGASSTAASRVALGAVGNGGSVNISTGSLSVTNGAGLTASTFGQGNAGNVNINALYSVSFDGVGSNGLASGVASQVEEGAVGKGGSINIKTGSLSITNGAGLSASTYGQGDAGNVNINASDTVSLDGVSSDGFSSEVASRVELGAVGNGGSINIDTGSLSLTNGARLTASTFGQGNAGNVNINASDQVSFDGVGSNGVSSAAFSTVDVTAVGKGGGITINTGSLALTNGAQLQASTFGQGDAGSVTINASDTVFFDGIGSNGFASAAVSTVAPGAEGNGSDIKITTGSFSVTNGAGVAVGTAGQGNSGNVTISARDTVSLDRADVLSTVEEGAVGKSGDITITTGTFSMANGTQLASSTFGQGKAGNVTIDALDTVSITGESTIFSTLEKTGVGQGGDISITAESVSMTDGAQLQTSSFGQGDAGNITLNVRGKLSLDGVGSDGLPTGAASQVEEGAVGNGGDIDINTESLSLSNGAVLSVSSLGQGSAGDIKITSQSIELNNYAGIGATTLSGDGGNITLQVQDLLLMRYVSRISTSAGTASAGGDGGNITINAPFIVAVPSENSDITANAFTGNGGRVQITAQGIFGLEFRPELTPLSDITASSRFGLDGVVEINTPDVDPSRGLTELPADIIDVSSLINQNLCAAGQGSEFTVTGRGGLPTSPNEALSPDTAWEDWRMIRDSEPLARAQQSVPIPLSTLTNNPQRIKDSQPRRFVEAQGWILDAKGNVVLTAEAIARQPHPLWLTALVGCSR